jgi:hypothetical protein
MRCVSVRVRGFGPGHARQVFAKLGDSQWYEVSVEQLPSPMWMRFGQQPDGSIALTGLVLRARPPHSLITHRSLVRIPVAKLLRMGQPGHAFDWLFCVGRTIHFPARRKAAHPGRQPISSKELEDFARDYRRISKSNPTSSIRAVARARHMSTATAYRRLARCRELKLL